MQSMYYYPPKRRNQRGQIAVVITLIIAAVFLLTMVFINIYKVSTVKTLTSQTADKTALRIASKIGSISKVYFDALGALPLLAASGGLKYDAVNKTVYVQYCNLYLSPWSLPLLAVVALAGVVMFWLIPYVPVLLTGIGLFVSMTMTTGIVQKFQDMTAYNSIREEALFQAMLGLQSDYVELKNLGGAEQGIFQDPNPDPADSITEIKYDLNAIPGMKKAIKVPRFLAWYYTKRFPLVDESALKDALNDFIYGRNDSLRDGIRKYVYIYRNDADPNDDWDEDKWKIKKLTLTLAGQRSPYTGGFLVTCGGSCPSWVLNSATDTIKLLNIKEDDTIDNAMGGNFIKTQLEGCDYLPLVGCFVPDVSNCWGILKRLECQYGKVFCEDADCLVKPEGELDRVVEDMRLIMVRIKEVLNLPEAERLRGLTQWFTAFYSPADHDLSTKQSNHAEGTYDENNSYDIYLRIFRDRFYIQKWITGLTNFDTARIIPPIIPNYDASSCKQGRGNVTDWCYTDINRCCDKCCNDSTCWCCGSECANQQEARWAGIYGTCYKSNSHNDNPVCQKGDLYDAIPGWCSDYRPETGCLAHTKTNCCEKTCTISCVIPGEKFSNTLPPEYYYQGQLSWSCQGCPTELGQVIDILREWDKDLARLQFIIGIFQNKIAYLQTPEIKALRNEIVYAWRDQQGGSVATNIPQYLHVASVKIEDYPLSLPYITEKTDFEIKWLFGCKTRILHDYKGTFEITAARYDQDQLNQIWNLRRRKQPLDAEVMTVKLDQIVAEIQPSGRITSPTPQDSLDDILANYAIVSKTKVQYGPGRKDIAIIEVKN